MFELFLNPWLMVAGGALVSAPIIIHLINRLRYKRVRWAAMEFLLKSQKKNRRKLIIEQLILLALRCFLVLLFAFLVARFIGASLDLQPQGTIHLVLLDDTLSMSDQWKDKGTPRTSFEVAKKILDDKIVRQAAQANSQQKMRVYLLSDLDKPIFDKLLSNETINELTKAIQDKKPSALHVPPALALAKAATILREPQWKDHQKIVHLLSDFRYKDWQGSQAQQIYDEVNRLSAPQDVAAQVYLVDTSDPIRSDARQELGHHDNLALTDLRPRSRIVPEGAPVTLYFTTYNFSNKPFKNLFFKVFINGQEDAGASGILQDVPIGPKVHTKPVFNLSDGFNLISVEVTDPDGLQDVGIRADNKRFTVVEVRKSVTMLVIDGDYANPLAREGGKVRLAADAPSTCGTYFLEKALRRTNDFALEPGTVEDLKKPSLFSYPAVFLVNVPEIKDEQAVKNLERYVQEGGGLCFFLGDKIKTAEYDRVLFKDGKGVFPVPLQNQIAEDKNTDLPRLVVFKESHPVIDAVRKEDAGKLVDFYLFETLIPKYYRVDTRRFIADENPQVEPILVKPNQQKLTDYREEAVKLVQRIPVNAGDNGDWGPLLRKHQDEMLGNLSARWTELSQLSFALDDLLNDPGRKPNPDKADDKGVPSMVEFWSQEKHRGLRTELEKFRARIRFGDPILYSKPVGKGRVVACLTSAGSSALDAWTNWATNPDAATSYNVFLPAVRDFLLGPSDAAGTTGTPMTIERDANLYEGKLKVLLMSETAERQPIAPEDTLDVREKKLGLLVSGQQEVPAKEDRFTFRFDGARTPGVYLFRFQPRMADGAGEAPPPETRAYVFNVDAEQEGELRRSVTDVLLKGPTGAGGHTGKVTVMDERSDFSSLSNRQTDLSESPWLYLLFLIVLVAEQALAVHLSFHTRGGQDAMPAAAQMPTRVGTMVTP